MKNRVIIILNIILILLIYQDFCLAETGSISKNNEQFRKIKDLDDKIIEIPLHPRRIAMLHGPSYDRILMLANSDVIALMPMIPTKWTYRIFPESRKIPVVSSYINVEVEQLLNYKVDLVFYSMHPAQTEKLMEAGIKVACPFSEKKLPKNIDEFKENYKRQVIFYGEILGPTATTKAKKYCNYFDTTIDKVLSRTSSIPEKKKPDVYYGGLNGDLFYTQGKNTVMQWCVVVAGGKYLTRNYTTHFARVNMEQLISWDPDFMFIGMKGSFDLINIKLMFKNTKAVKNNNIYKIPAGTFWWDLASGESVLLPLFLAKKFHPELFEDWDLIEEMKYFYSEFYNYRISEKEAKRILLSLPPDTK